MSYREIEKRAFKVKYRKNFKIEILTIKDDRREIQYNENNIKKYLDICYN